MEYDNAYYQRYQDGGARWATEEEIAAAGLFGGNGHNIGFYKGRPLTLPFDGGHTLVLGGSGAGKWAAVGAYRTFQPTHTFSLDPKGERTSVCIHSQVRYRKRAYVINPRRMHSGSPYYLPHHRVNVWEDITPDSPHFHSYSQLAGADLIPRTDGGDGGKWWEEDAIIWSEKFIKALALQRGRPSMPEFHQVVSQIHSDPIGWINDFGSFMASCGLPDVEEIGEEVHRKLIKGEGVREGSAVLATIRQNINFLSDPAMADTLGPNPDFSLKIFTENDQAYDVSLVMPAEDFATCKALPRTIIGAIERYKLRNPGTMPVRMEIDEAAQLGRFGALQRLMEMGRGPGLPTTTYWQDAGQIERLYGKASISTFWGNCEARLILGGGIRDLASAQMVAASLGKQTLEIDDRLKQAEAWEQHQAAVQRYVHGTDDPIAALRAARLTKFKTQHKTKKPRDLLSPDEILNLPRDRMIVLVSGLRPILAEKWNYWDRPEAAGWFLSNPYRAENTVQITTRFGSQWRRIISEKVPAALADWPQYQQRQIWSYVEGFRP